MFSLIISIIAIALVAALALASIYYGGSAFQEGSADAEASTVVNQGQQIQAALTLAAVDETTVATIAAIPTTFLKEVPKVRAEAWDKQTVSRGSNTTNLDSGDLISVEVNSLEVCKKIEERFDDSETVETYANLDALAGNAAVQAFGCYTDGTDYFAYFKL